MSMGKIILYASATVAVVGVGALVASNLGGTPLPTGQGQGGQGEGEGRLAGYELAEWTTGGASPGAELPTIVILHAPSSGDQAVRQAFANFPAPARLVVPLGRTGEGQVRSYVDPTLPNIGGRLQIESVALQSLLAAVLQSRKVLHRVIVVGLGGSGTLAMLLGLYAGASVRQAYAVGGTLDSTQVAPAPTAAVQLRMLVSGGLLPGMAEGTLAAVQLAASRGFDAHAEVGGVQALPTLIQTWLWPQLTAGLLLP